MRTSGKSSCEYDNLHQHSDVSKIKLTGILFSPKPVRNDDNS